jgi:UDPglucose 6-dehydrogenase
VICFLGSSHAPTTLAAAARANGLKVTDEPSLASLIFVSDDTPTDELGVRDVSKVTRLVVSAISQTSAPVVLTSQVPPGFTRSFTNTRLIHMAETLRMKDAMQRARHPEQFIVGVPDPHEYVLPVEFMHYLYAHEARVLIMSYEEAEYAKIAINMMLAAQVDATNRLAAGAAKVGAKWERVAQALQCDSRIGPHAYLTPGRWQDSRHLLRDHVTLEEILAR